MSNSVGLWGELSPEATIRPPALILKEQADLFNDTFKGILTARVENTRAGTGMIGHTLNIIAPLLGNYEYQVIRIVHPILLYPLTMMSAEQAHGFTCENENSFLESLETTLKSETVHQAIASLVAQSKASN